MSVGRDRCNPGGGPAGTVRTIRSRDRAIPGLKATLDPAGILNPGILIAR
jgi:FAD/FMN-containing dehydrogenase